MSFKNNKYLLFLLFIFLIPLKEDYSSKGLILVFTFVILPFFYNNRHAVKFKLKEFRKIKITILISSFIILIYNLLTLKVAVENIDYNRFSFIGLFILFSVCFVFSSYKLSLKKIVYSLFLGLTISGLYRVYLSLCEGTIFKFTRIEIPFYNYISSNPIIYAVLLNFCYGGFLFLVSKKQINKKYFFVFLLLTILFHFSYFSSSGFIIFLIINFLFLLYLFSAKLFKISTVLLQIICFALFLFTLSPKGSLMFETLDGDSSRIRNFSTSLTIIKKAPFFGYGIGNEINILQKERNPNVWEYKQKYHAHNQYFEFLIGGGIINLTVYLLFFISAFILAFKKKDIVFIFFLINITFVMYIESLLITHKGFVFSSLLLSYFIFNNDKESNYKF